MADQGVTPLAPCNVQSFRPANQECKNVWAMDISTPVPASSSTPLQVTKKEPVFADTECAQALLELAKSVASFSHNGISEISSDSPVGTTSEPDDVKQDQGVHKYDVVSDAEGNNSESNCLVQTVLSSDQFSYSPSNEVIKRIRLDHNYAWMGLGDEQRFGFLPKYLEQYPKGASLFSQKDSNGHSVLNGKCMRKTSHSPKNSRQVVISPRHEKNVKVVKVQNEKMKTDEGLVGNADVYEPEDSKYEKFNLLLKCLTNEEGTEESRANRRRYDSNASSMRLSVSSVESPSASSEDSVNMPEGGFNEIEGQFYCVLCLKSFTKKRYLTKHFRRMHPTSVAELPVPCPTCKGFITKSSLKQHRLVCGGKRGASQEANLADCQFCGMRMRRHVLVRHLAIEHCQDVGGSGLEFPDKVNNNEDTDGFSDSSTLSGSEHDHSDVMMATSPRGAHHMVPRPTRGEHTTELMQGTKLNYKFEFSQSILSKNTVKCQLCDQRVSRMQLTEHLASVHNADNPSHVQSTDVQSVPSKPSPHCNHSMLQRFLSDSSGQDPSNEECQSCVGRLMGGHTSAEKKHEEINSPQFDHYHHVLSPKLNLSPTGQNNQTDDAVYTALVSTHQELPEVRKGPAQLSVTPS